MCGICGVFNSNSSSLIWEKELEQSVNLLKNRGPNGNGTFFHEHIALGHTRLAVIDTSENANQPLTDYTGRYTIVFNGEFFNYKEHRLKLEQKGYVFKTLSDTEVLLNLYIDLGKDFLNEVNGCFAIAIYDKIKNTLFLARDRFGIKPLVFYKDENKFIFASEIKAILPFKIDKAINNEAVRLYTYLNYIPAPQTIYKNIYKLNPGHFIQISKSNFEIKQYYKIEINDNESDILNFDKSKKQLKKLLEESVERRLISDVPIGTFLSGGLDSSIITAIASKQTKHLNTFSVGFSDDKHYDETESALAVAQKFNTNHTVFKLSRNRLLEEAFHFLDYNDEPFADSSAIAVSALSKETKKHVTVALSGDGADELHAGYNKHFAHYKAQNSIIVNKIALLSYPIWLAFPKSRESYFSNKSRQILKYLNGISKTDAERYWYWASFASVKSVNKLLLNNGENIFENYKKEILSNINNNYNSLLLTDMNLVLPNDMLFKVDSMSMSHGLEVRVPMLDHKVVDFMFTLKSNFKINQNHQKFLLKETFKDVLPQSTLLKKKHGFEVPLLPWLNNELNYLIENKLNKENIENIGVYNYNTVNQLKKQIKSKNPLDSASQLWNILVFQNWADKTLK